MRPGCWTCGKMTSWSAPCRAFHSATRRSSVRRKDGPIRSGWRRSQLVEQGDRAQARGGLQQRHDHLVPMPGERVGPRAIGPPPSLGARRPRVVLDAPGGGDGDARLGGPLTEGGTPGSPRDMIAFVLIREAERRRAPRGRKRRALSGREPASNRGRQQTSARQSLQVKEQSATGSGPQSSQPPTESFKRLTTPASRHA